MPRAVLPVVLMFALVIVVAGWLLWLRPGGEAVPNAPLPHEGAAAHAPAGLAAGDRADDGEPVTAAVVEREPVAATPAGIVDGEALLRVTAVAAEGRPQPAVMVEVRPQRGNRRGPPVGKGLTDDEGRIEFAKVTPGTLYVTSDRRDGKKFDVPPGLTEIELVVKAGIDVVGKVLDGAGAPVAGAAIWLQTASNGWDGGRVIGEAGDDGTFAIAHVAPDCSLGAFASGFAPSALIDLDVVDKSVSPAMVELHLLQHGGDLVGRVTDADGAPIRGAQVVVGDRTHSPDWENGRFIEAWGERCVETDAQGRYRFIGVPVGPSALTARGQGFGIVRDEVAITAGETATRDLTLTRAAALFGKVTDKHGNAEVGACVSAYDGEPGTRFVSTGQIDFDLTFGPVETFTDERGEYRLDGVTAGTVWAFAQRFTDRGSSGESVALARDTLEVAVGSRTRWDPIIDDGRSIAGVVRYRDGFPVQRLYVTLRDERSGQDAVIDCDQEGRFRFLGLADSTYAVHVQPLDVPHGSTAPPALPGVVPDGAPVVITLAYDKPAKETPGKARGRIADTGARIRLPGAATIMVLSETWYCDGIKLVDGAFVVDGVQPGRFRVVLKEGDKVLGFTDWFEMAPAGDVDIGVLATEPGGALRIEVERGKGTEAFEPRFYVDCKGDPLGTLIELGRGNVAFADSLTPGHYAVSSHVVGMLSVAESCEVRAGEATVLKVVLRPGAVGKVEVWWPEGHTGSTTRGYKLTAAGGAVVQEFEGPLYSGPTRPYPLHFTLAAGRYHLDFSTDDGLRGDLDFEIPASLVAPELRLDLK